MSTLLPFRISPQAENYIRPRLHSQPGSEVALVQTFRYEERDRHGEIMMRFPGEFFTVGNIELGLRPHALHIEIFGVPVSIIPQTLERLRGTTLFIHEEIFRYGWFRKKKMRFLVAA